MSQREEKLVLPDFLASSTSPERLFFVCFCAAMSVTFLSRILISVFLFSFLFHFCILFFKSIQFLYHFKSVAQTHVCNERKLWKFIDRNFLCNRGLNESCGALQTLCSTLNRFCVHE